jgi:uncharacterized protein DUF2183
MRNVVLCALLLAGCREPTATPSPGVTPTGSASTTAAGTPADPEHTRARQRSPVKSDERVVLFPSFAARTADGSWAVDLHAWIFEPEEDSIVRNALLHKLAKPVDPAERARFEQRLRAFLVDNESGKALSVAVGDQVLDLPASAADGHAVGSFTLPSSIASQATEGVLEMQIVVRDGDDRRFAAPLVLVEPEGTSIISDIDDTVKVSEVRDKERLLRRTFLEEFEFVPGMAPLYKRLVPSALHLHFVTSSPWQLYEPLAEMLARAGFPPATVSMKRVRPRNVLQTIDELLGDPLETKPPAIREVLDKFPKRSFILVGDSGEKDPEVYGLIARERPQQIARIAIRDVTDEPREAPRYATAFEGVPGEKWVVFKQPDSL